MKTLNRTAYLIVVLESFIIGRPLVLFILIFTKTVNGAQLMRTRT